MKPTDFKESNFTFTKPEEMTDEQCGSLPVYRGIDPQGFPILVSAWKLTPEEILHASKTGIIWLCVSSQLMPPVSLHAVTPFQEENG